MHPELSRDNRGAPRFDRAVGFDTGCAATIGWVSKIGGWSITDAGIEALETYPEPDELQRGSNGTPTDALAKHSA